MPMSRHDEQELCKKIDTVINDLEDMADAFRKINFEAWALALDHCVAIGRFTRQTFKNGLEQLRKDKRRHRT